MFVHCVQSFRTRHSAVDSARPGPNHRCHHSFPGLDASPFPLHQSGLLHLVYEAVLLAGYVFFQRADAYKAPYLPLEGCGPRVPELHLRELMPAYPFTAGQQQLKLVLESFPDGARFDF